MAGAAPYPGTATHAPKLPSQTQEALVAAIDMETFIPSSNTHPMLRHTGCILSILQHLSDEADVARAAATTRAWSQAACTDLIWRKLHISKWGEPDAREVLPR